MGYTTFAPLGLPAELAAGNQCKQPEPVGDRLIGRLLSVQSAAPPSRQLSDEARKRRGTKEDTSHVVRTGTLPAVRRPLGPPQAPERENDEVGS